MTFQRQNPIRLCPDDQNAEAAVAAVEAEGDAAVVAVSVSVFAQVFCPVWLEASLPVSVSFLLGSKNKHCKLFKCQPDANSYKENNVNIVFL
jgi:hypothetical protein